VSLHPVADPEVLDGQVRAGANRSRTEDAKTRHRMPPRVEVLGGRDTSSPQGAHGRGRTCQLPIKNGKFHAKKVKSGAYFCHSLVHLAFSYTNTGRWGRGDRPHRLPGMDRPLYTAVCCRAKPAAIRHRWLSGYTAAPRRRELSAVSILRN